MSLITGLSSCTAVVEARLSHAIPTQEARATFCGRVVDVSCTRRFGDVTLLLANSGAASMRQVVIPAEYRHLFGARLASRYDQQTVCVSPAASSVADNDRVLVRDPSELALKEVSEAAAGLPDDVARTCDADVQLPVVIRDVKPLFTPDAMRAKVKGSILLRGIVGRDGTVGDIRVVRPVEPSLDAAAVHAFSQWQFRPAIRDGAPVPIAISVEMTFSRR